VDKIEWEKRDCRGRAFDTCLSQSAPATEARKIDRAISVSN